MTEATNERPSRIETKLDMEAGTLTLVIPLNRITEINSATRDPERAMERGRVQMVGYGGPPAFTIRVRPSDDRDHEPITVHVDREAHAALMAHIEQHKRWF